MNEIGMQIQCHDNNDNNKFIDYVEPKVENRENMYNKDGEIITKGEDGRQSYTNIMGYLICSQLQLWSEGTSGGR